MAGLGYSNLTDRAFVGFEPELDKDAWNDISTKKYEEGAKDDAAVLIQAPLLVTCKLRLRFGIAGIVAAHGATSLVKLDNNWDATQRRLFHRIAVHVDDEIAENREAADRLFAQLLAGTGTAQTQLDFDAEVDWGQKQVRLTAKDGPLAADAKRLGLGDILAEVAKTTDALAAGLGRDTGAARKAPSRRLRDALAACAAAFNSVHELLSWFWENTPPGAERDKVAALLAPLERLLERNQTVAAPAKEPVKEASKEKEAGKEKDKEAPPAKEPVKDPPKDRDPEGKPG